MYVSSAGVTHSMGRRELPGIALSRYRSLSPMQRNDNVGSQQNWFKMPSRDINVSIYCPQPQVMALFVHGAAGPQGRFLFGNGGGWR